MCCIVATVLGKDLKPTRELVNITDTMSNIFLGVLLVVSLAAVVGLSVGVALVSNKQDSSSCLTPECVELGAQVLASLDETFDPCFDFYKFACNKALEQAIIPYGELISRVQWDGPTLWVLDMSSLSGGLLCYDIIHHHN